MKRIVIDGDMFRRLVAGKEVEREGVTIILADIGFGIMRQYINSAQEEPLTDAQQAT